MKFATHGNGQGGKMRLNETLFLEWLNSSIEAHQQEIKDMQKINRDVTHEVARKISLERAKAAFISIFNIPQEAE